MTIQIRNSDTGPGSHLSHMPLIVTTMLETTLSEAWNEFAADMVDEIDAATPEKFWKYLTRYGS